MRIGAGLGLGFLLVWLIVLLPLKAVVMLAGSAGYSDVYGTVWNGRIYDLALPGGAVRETGVRLRPEGLLTGRLVVDWQVDDASLRGRGQAALGPGGFSLEGADLAVTLDRLGAPVLPGLDPRERVQVRMVRLDLRDGICRVADGEARTGALVPLAAAQGLDGPVLTGRFVCRDGALVLDFEDMSDSLNLEGEAVFGAQAMVWQLTAQSGVPELADLLALAGFEREGDMWRGEGRRSYGHDE